jgi:hypothetical protein
MSDKSYVGMEVKRCIVCLEEYKTGDILLDRRLRDTLPRHTCTGIGLCPKCDRQFEGMNIFIEIDESKSKIEDSKVALAGAYRTGNLMGINYGAVKELFNVEVPRVSFMGSGTFKRIQDMKRKVEERKK